MLLKQLKNWRLLLMSSHKKKLLFISGRFPYPTHKGDQLLLFNNIKLFSKNYEITLISFYENKKDIENINKINKYCNSVVLVKRNKILSFLNVLASPLRFEPLQVGYYRSHIFKKKLYSLISSNDFDLIHVYMLRMSHYAETLSVPKVVSFIDSMYLNASRRAFNEKGLMKLVFKYECLLLKRYEKKMVRLYDKAVVVSEIDKKIIDSSNIVVIPVGIQPARGINLKSNDVIIFTGNMSYFPNQNAVKWFLFNCFDEIKLIRPNVRFLIVGKSPPDDILSFHDNKNIFVKGFVDSVADELLSATFAIAPMQSGSGMQIKVLESMSVGLPVVATSLGIGDIKATHDVECLIADTKEQFIYQCIRLLEQDDLVNKIGINAKYFIESKHSWGKVKLMYMKVYDSLLK